MKRWRKFFWKWGFSGLEMYIRYQLTRFLCKLGFRASFHCIVPDLGDLIVLRPGTSDLQVFDSIFLDEEYGINGIHHEFSPRFIIDAGANIGLSSLYFSHHFPQARIIAIEPEHSNFEILRQNTRHRPNIIPLNKALWSSQSLLKLQNPDARKFSFRFQQEIDENGTVAHGISVSDLLDQFQAEDIGIIKIDVEGAEKDIFKSNTDWLGKTQLIFIELHDRKQPGCTPAFYSAVAPHIKEQWVRGETHIVMTKQCPFSSLTPEVYQWSS